MKFLNDKIELLEGDCLVVLPTLAENSIDAVVCDPPYHLTSIVKRFGKDGAAPAQFGKDGAYARASSGFMGKQWDGGDIAFRVETWREVYHVMKPGAHLIAFGGTRTYHRMACAIEDAGFEIRDQIQWLYGSGFPKSHDVSKGIDRAAGAEREVVATRKAVDIRGDAWGSGNDKADDGRDRLMDYAITTPATAAAAAWEGWGTALKPACEPIVLARKPLSESTVAANVLKWGTGALNIDGCRVGDDVIETCNQPGIDKFANIYGGNLIPKSGNTSHVGRWPANVIHDGSEEVVEAFPDVHGVGVAREGSNNPRPPNWSGNVPNAPDHNTGDMYRFGDEGSASRFFYTAKADSDDRLGSKHPTVKPLDLMQYLVRLVTPPCGVVLDPFAGTGTTGEAAWREGFNAVLIEREAEYQTDIKRRMALCLSGPDERAREAIKARMKDKPIDNGPLFGGAEQSRAEQSRDHQTNG